MNCPVSGCVRQARATARWVLVFAAFSIMISCASRVSYRELAQEYYNLGNAFFEIGDYDRSYEYYSRAVELDNTLPVTGYNLVRLHLQRGEYEQAAEVINRLLENDPDNSLYLETAAYTVYKTGKIDAARDEYRSLIDRFPARARLYYNLAVLEMEQEHFDVAYGILDDGLTYASDDREYLWLMSEAAYEADDHESTEQILDRYRTAAREDENALTRLAERYAQWDYTLAALDVISQLPDHAQDENNILFLGARLLLTGTTEFEQGLLRLRQALEGGYDNVDELAALYEDLPSTDQTFVENLYEEFSINLEIPEESDSTSRENSDG